MVRSDQERVVMNGMVAVAIALTDSAALSGAPQARLRRSTAMFAKAVYAKKPNVL